MFPRRLSRVRGDLAWGAVLLAAILLPVGATADWFTGAYTATEADLRAGVWILKGSVAALALAAMALPKLLADGVERAAGQPARPGPAIVATLGAIVVLAIGLRLHRIDTELWLDEILLRARYVPLEFRQLLSTYDSQNHQPLYSIMSRVMFLIFGGTDWWIRLPAVAFGVASLIALYSFARRITTTAESLLAAFLLAVSYHHVWFSQNARGYTAMLFLTILGTQVFRDLCEGRGSQVRLTWAYATVMALATYTHLTAALIAVGHAVALAATTRWAEEEDRQRVTAPIGALVLSALLTVTLYAPMLPQVLRDVTKPTMEGVAVEWTGAGWMLREATRVLSRGVPGGLWTVLVAFTVLVVGIVSYWRQSRITTLLMFLPVGVTMAAILAARHNLWPRFFFFASGFLVLAALRGGFVLVRAVVRWQPERVAIAGATAVGLLSLLTVPRAWQPKQQFLAAQEFIEQQRRAGDAVVALDAAGEVYRLLGSLPRWGTAANLPELQELERTAGRTWVVFTLPAKMRAVTPDLYEHVTGPDYPVIQVFSATVGGGEIHVRRRDSVTAHD